MGGFHELEKQAKDAEERVIAGQERLKRRGIALREHFRQRYLVGTLLIAGLAAGVAVHQYIRIKAIASARHNLRPPATVRRASQASSPSLRKSLLPLLPLAQWAVTNVLSSKRGKKRRRTTPRPDAIAPVPEIQEIHSQRSTSLADPSIKREGNGLLRH